MTSSRPVVCRIQEKDSTECGIRAWHPPVGHPNWQIRQLCPVIHTCESSFTQSPYDRWVWRWCGECAAACNILQHDHFCDLAKKYPLRRLHRPLHTVQATGTLKAVRYLDETFRNISFIEELQCVIDVIPVLSTKSITRKMNGEQPLVCSYTLDIIDMISFKGALRHTALCRHYHTIFFFIKSKEEGILMHTWPDLILTHLLDLFSNIIKPQAWMSSRVSVHHNIQQQRLSNISCLFSPPLCVCVCVNRIWLCGLWQPRSSPEGCGLAQSQWRPGTDGEGKLHPICHPPFLIIKVFSGAVILLRDSLCLNPGAIRDEVLLASEAIADDIGSQVISIDRIIDNEIDHNYVLR